MSGDVEAVKAASRHLRGHLSEELTRPEDPFDDQSAVLLKFHGIYQQDDRDVRRERAAKKLPLEHSCMVRASVPGGRLQPEQWRALDRVAELADGSLRLTTRQGVQFHATAKANLRPLISSLNAELVTTLGACGDVVRNTVACPMPHADGREHVLGPAVAAIAAHFRPKTAAYWEIWLDGDRAVSAHPGERRAGIEEPIYGDVYLPRKFKIGLAWPGDNCIDVHGHDVGLVPTLTDGYRGELTGWTILVGGGLGMSHAREDDTYPRLASPVGWVEPERLIPAIEAVVTMQRDHGERVDRQRNRLKYLVDDRGTEWVRAQIEERLGAPVGDPPELLPWLDHDEHHGWSPTDSGDWVLGVPIPSGRLRDDDAWRPRAAVRELLDAGLVREIRVSARQDLLLTGIDGARRDEVTRRLRDHGIKLDDEVTPLQRLAIACPALPTCGQALGEAERVLPTLVDGLDKVFADSGVAGTPVRLNMTGCPNGCARPYNAEIGVVGRTKRTYDVYVGGAAAGDRLGVRLRADVGLDEIPTLLAPVVERFGAERTDGETFGDFCLRVGVQELETVLPAPTVRRRGRRS
ncbi:MAG: NADPH-dependent assimilatory sulfite reductase hemoprotein subunit [Actinobacteria bacterium]|nr:NADPH-dependent assimilatory sulfite reductase hemoprotein subunit [Actinomycetota bacterium]